MSDVIVFDELQIVSKTGEFYYELAYNNSSRVMKTDEETFKDMFVTSAKIYDGAKKKHGENSNITKKAFERYKYYENQIDLTQGDMFTAMLFPIDKWESIK